MRVFYRASFCRVRQRGAMAVIMAVLLLSLILTLVTLSVDMSGSGGYDTAAQNDAVEALFLAESALERTGKLFNATPAPACTGLEVGVDYDLPRGTFRVTQVFNTKFDGTAFPSANWCRVQTRGVITATGVTRVIEGIIKRGKHNLLPDSANADFNNPTGVCRIDLGCTLPGWTSLMADVPAGRLPQHAYQPWDDCSGLPGPSPLSPVPWPGYPAIDNQSVLANGVTTPCSTTGLWDRAAFVRKGWSGQGAGTSAGTFNFSPAITVTAPTTLYLEFDYYLNCFGGICASGNDMQLTSNLQTSGGEKWWSCSSDVTPCIGSDSTFFPAAPPYERWAIGKVAIPILGSGTKLISSLQFFFALKAGQEKQAWLDNLLVTPASGTTPTTVELLQWREIVQ